MTTATILSSLWELMNTPVGITAIASAVLWLLNRLYAKKPAWQAFEGSIIAAVKWAEKEIPDDTPNKAFLRLNSALTYVQKVYAEARGVPPSSAVKAELSEGIQIVHAQLEASGNLTRPAAAEG